MNVPISTYRVQLHRAFTLRQLKEILPYLHQLGITTVYTSPFFEAVPGSTHGYDVLNPHRINPELGTEADLLEISQWLTAHQMTWLQDIVPNHMSSSSENPWLYDVLEKGPFSNYYDFFDILWHHPHYPGQLMVPLLDKPLEEELAAGNFSLEWGEKGFHFRFYEHRFPVCFRQYASLLQSLNERLSSEPVTGKYADLVHRSDAFAAIQPKESLDEQTWTQFKQELYAFVQANGYLKQAITTVLKQYQSEWQALRELLNDQNFCLVPWQETDKAINYRRFFTINDLICLRMESEQTFAHYHLYIQSLLDKGIIQSLRIDHIDGLYDPKNYLQKLRQLAGEETYIIVEKILEPNEYLPADWEVQGTTGYDFLSLVNRLLISDKSTDSLSEFYSQIHVLAYEFEEAVFRKKLFMLIHHMGGELDNLTEQLMQLFPAYTMTDEMRISYRQVLAYWLVSFPVYRFYLNEKSLSATDAAALKSIFEQAKTKAPGLEPSFEEVQPLLAPEPGEVPVEVLRFLMRTQQFTGPLMAKGVEDTTFYVYNRLISRNEVGDTPQADENINAFRFHEEMRKRSLTAMNATATHDTKRGEDARMRINVLSELAEEWKSKVYQWQSIAQSFYFTDAGKTAPDSNDEYFIYQTLVGTYPLHTNPENEEYHTRLKDYFAKVIREAKVHTNWSNPDEVYEQSVLSFVENLLNTPEFRNSFVPFVQKVAAYGAIYSLIQTMIRLTAPGVPDTYQGTEFWDLSMVDPDNRRPVDYQERRQVLENLIVPLENPDQWQKLLQNPLNPALKMFVLRQLLLTRRENPELFLHGKYRSLLTAGTHARKLVAYTRQWEDQQVLVLFPTEIVSLCLPGQFPVGSVVWEDTYLGWEESNDTEYTNVFTGETTRLSARQPVGELLHTFPIGCWLKKIN